MREWVDGIQLFIRWHSWFSEAGSWGGSCLGERRQSYCRVTCHRTRPLTCCAVSLSQAFVLCSDGGIRRHLRGCQGESEVSAWWGWGDYVLERRNTPLGKRESVALRHLLMINRLRQGTGAMGEGRGPSSKNHAIKSLSAVKKKEDFMVFMLMSRRQERVCIKWEHAPEPARS